MDKEWKELLEQKFLIFSKREDIERLRQEILSQFFKFREDYKDTILQGLRETKEAIEKIKEEGRGYKWELTLEGIERNVEKISDRLNQEVHRDLQGMKMAFENLLEQFKGEIESNLQRIRDENLSQFSSSSEETRTNLWEIRETLKNLNEQVRNVAEERALLNERLKEGFEGIKEELGSMIRFSYGDLERRLNALEMRVKALEKMVLP